MKVLILACCLIQALSLAHSRPSPHAARKTVRLIENAMGAPIECATGIEEDMHAFLMSIEDPNLLAALDHIARKRYPSKKRGFSASAIFHLSLFGTPEAHDILKKLYEDSIEPINVALLLADRFADLTGKKSLMAEVSNAGPLAVSAVRVLTTRCGPEDLEFILSTSENLPFIPCFWETRKSNPELATLLVENISQDIRKTDHEIAATQAMVLAMLENFDFLDLVQAQIDSSRRPMTYDAWRQYIEWSRWLIQKGRIEGLDFTTRLLPLAPEEIPPGLLWNTAALIPLNTPLYLPDRSYTYINAHAHEFVTEVTEWWEANRNKIEYDQETKRFVFVPNT